MKPTARILTLVLALVVLGGLVQVAISAPAAAPSQAYTWKNVVTGGGGGYTPGIIFNTAQANLIYAREDIGGAYRWDEPTQSWIQLLNWVSADDWSDTGVDGIATDSVDPNRLYLLVGTYTNAWSNANGAILRSTDKGNTFTKIPLTFKVGGNMPGRNMGERIVIDPNKNSILFLGARSGNGLWKSTDFGGTWTKVTSFPDPGQYAQLPGDPYLGDIMGLAWIAFDPQTGTPGNATQTIYVGVGDPNGTNIYKTTDGGTTWAAVAGQVTCSNAGGSVTCTNGTSWTVGAQCPQHAGVGLIPHHGVISPDGFLYVSYSDTLGPYDGDIGDVYKLNLSTGVWMRISPVPSTAGGVCTGGVMGLLTGYGGLSVDRQNPQRIMVAELNRWWPDVNLWLSTNGGTTWTSAWDGVWPPAYNHLSWPDITAAPWLNFGITNPPQGEPPVKLGWMVGDIEIDPFNSNRFMYGTGATIYGSTNLGNWATGGKSDVRVMAKGIEETSVLDIVSPPSGTIRLYTGMGDIGGFRHVNLAAAPSAMYTTPNLGSNTDLDYAELTTNFWVRVGNIDKNYNPTVNRAGFSYDSGGNWFQANNEPAGVTGGGTVAAAANASRVVWAPSGAAVSVSTDNGNSWTAAQGIPSGATVASDRVNPSKFYGLANGSFYVSTNGGLNFSVASTGLPTFGEVKAVPGVDGDVWVVGGASDSAPWGMWHSTNSGTTFTKLANVQGADSIGFGKAATGQTYPAIYAAAKIDNVRGIYRSEDGGANWVRINDDQHQYASIQTITGDPTIYGRVYIGTNGLGALYGDPSGPVPTPTNTSVVTNTPTNTPVVTNTPTNTPVASNTPTNTPVASNTPTNTPVASNTPTNTPVASNTPTNTPLPSNTPTNTPVGPTNTPTNTPLPSNTPTNTPIPPTNTPTNTPVPGGNPCSSPTVITGGGSYSVSITGTCFKYVNAAFVRGGMFSVMNGSDSTVSNVVKWYGGRNETVTNCINDTQTLNGNGAQINNFTVAKDANNAMYVTVTGNKVNTITLNIQNWQNGTGCSVAPTPQP